MDKPDLLLLSPSLGTMEALVFIGGSLSAPIDSLGYDQWERAIRQAGWEGAIFALEWENKGIQIKLEDLAQLGVEAILEWHKYKNYARRLAKSQIPKLLAPLPFQSVSLLSFSLGTQIAYYVMKERSLTIPNLNDVILLAGTIRRSRDKEWSLAVNFLTGKLFDVYNTDDWVLKRFSQILEWDRSPCGIKPIKEVHPQIINVDATSLMATKGDLATRYVPVLTKIFTQEIVT